MSSVLETNYNLNSDLTKEAFANQGRELNFPMQVFRQQKTRSVCTRLQDTVSTTFSQVASSLANPPLFSSASRRGLFLKSKETIGAGLKTIYNRFKEKRSSFEESHLSYELTIDDRMIPAKKQKTEINKRILRTFPSWEKLPKDLLLKTLAYFHGSFFGKDSNTMLWVCKSWQQMLLEDSFSEPAAGFRWKDIILLRSGFLKFFRISSPNWMSRRSLSLMRQEEERRLLNNENDPYKKLDLVSFIDGDSEIDQTKST